VAAVTEVVAVTVTEVVVVTVVALAVQAVVTRVTAVPIIPAALTVTATAMGSAVIMLADPSGIMVKAETTTAMIATVIAVMGKRLQASPTPKILTA